MWTEERTFTVDFQFLLGCYRVTSGTITLVNLRLSIPFRMLHMLEAATVAAFIVTAFNSF